MFLKNHPIFLSVFFHNQVTGRSCTLVTRKCKVYHDSRLRYLHSHNRCLATSKVGTESTNRCEGYLPENRCSVYHDYRDTMYLHATVSSPWTSLLVASILCMSTVRVKWWWLFPRVRVRVYWEENFRRENTVMEIAGRHEERNAQQLSEASRSARSTDIEVFELLWSRLFWLRHD